MDNLDKFYDPNKQLFVLTCSEFEQMLKVWTAQAILETRNAVMLTLDNEFCRREVQSNPSV